METYAIATALINYKDKYLIGKRSSKKKFSPNTWEFISGFVESKESAEKNILRELKEEINLKGVIIKTSNPYVIKINNERWIIIPFLIKVTRNTFTLNKRDHSELKWVDKFELSNYRDLQDDISNFRSAGFFKN